MAKVSKPTVTSELGELVERGAIVPEGLGGPETRYRLDIGLHEPIDGINEEINDWLFKMISRHPRVRLPYRTDDFSAEISE